MIINGISYSIMTGKSTIKMSVSINTKSVFFNVFLNCLAVFIFYKPINGH